MAHISQAQDGESLEHVAPAVRGELEPQPRLRIVVVGLDAAVGDLRYEGKERDTCVLCVLFYRVV